MEKKFLYESDREVVYKIVVSTLVSSLLHDAVVQQDEDDVRTFLELLHGFGNEAAINYAVDEDSLDTLLHVAMRLPSTSIVNLLIEYGADLEYPNFRGDTPQQFFMIPRRWLPCLRVH